jgi:CxxC motif-containing protein
MKRSMICVICPNGCLLEVDYEEEKEGIQIKAITGELCKKGPKWAQKELVLPMRTVTSSVLVEGGELPLVSVRTNTPIPLDRVLDLMEEIRKLKVKAPVKIGQVILEDPKGIKTQLIATREVRRATT